MSERQQQRAAFSRLPRFASLASRLAFITFALVACVSLFVAFELTRRERSLYIESKSRAAEMLTQLLSSALTPALDFSDAEAVKTTLEMLAHNPEVVDAVVWSAEGDTPLARLTAAGDPVFGSQRQALGTRAFDAYLDSTLLITNPTGKLLGTVTVRVSLTKENAEFSASKRRTFWLAIGLSGLVAGLFVLVTRRTILSPLANLERAAGRLARGELSEVTELAGNEIGELGRAFNAMGRSIREREQRIGAVNGRLQGLLDNMRQAIVVFDATGQLGIERSRLAHRVLGHSLESKSNIRDVLFGEQTSSEIEREAFDAWLSATAEASAEEFSDLASLAPAEVMLHDEVGRERWLELEFRRVPDGEDTQRFMLLATDVTSERQLARTAEAQEREHQKQLAAMRRLVASGAQLFVRFLASARERLNETRKEFETWTAFGPQQLERAFQLAHTLRAEARSFDVGGIEKVAFEIELQLAGVRHAPVDGALRTLAHKDFGAALETLSAEIDRAEEVFVSTSPIGRRVLDQVTVSRSDLDALFAALGGRADESGRLVRRLMARPFGELVTSLPEAVKRWSLQQGTQVTLNVRGAEVLVPHELSGRLGGILGHLVSNAIAHGIELPAGRKARGKPEVGCIELDCEEVPGGVVIEVLDDGSGFDDEALSKRAGEVQSSEMPAIDLAFIAGVSTKEVPDALAGHGVGLGAVRADLEKIGYAVRVGSDRGRGTHILIEPAGVRG